MATTQGDLLRKHREAKGMTLEAVAFSIGQAARLRGIPDSSKSIPRTHASLSRWENGKVQIKEQGLELVAEALGVSVDDLRRPPPPPNAPPTRMVEVPADQAEIVDAFLRAVKAK